MGVVSGNAQLTTSFNQTVSTGVVSSQTIPAQISISTQYTNGTTASAVDLIHAKQYSLTASTPQTIDLTSIADLSGASVSFARVRVLAIQVVTATAGSNLTVGNAASNAFSAFWGATGTQTVYAGTVLYISDATSTGGGVGAIVDSTHKNVKLDPGSNNLTVNLMIVGDSAA